MSVWVVCARAVPRWYRGQLMRRDTSRAGAARGAGVGRQLVTAAYVITEYLVAAEGATVPRTGRGRRPRWYGRSVLGPEPISSTVAFPVCFRNHDPLWTCRGRASETECTCLGLVLARNRQGLQKQRETITGTSQGLGAHNAGWPPHAQPTHHKSIRASSFRTDDASWDPKKFERRPIYSADGPGRAAGPPAAIPRTIHDVRKLTSGVRSSAFGAISIGDVSVGANKTIKPSLAAPHPTSTAIRPPPCPRKPHRRAWTCMARDRLPNKSSKPGLRGLVRDADGRVAVHVRLLAFTRGWGLDAVRRLATQRRSTAWHGSKLRTAEAVRASKSSRIAIVSEGHGRGQTAEPRLGSGRPAIQLLSHPSPAAFSDPVSPWPRPQTYDKSPRPPSPAAPLIRPCSFPLFDALDFFTALSLSNLPHCHHSPTPAIRPHVHRLPAPAKPTSPHRQPRQHPDLPLAGLRTLVAPSRSRSQHPPSSHIP